MSRTARTARRLRVAAPTAALVHNVGPALNETLPCDTYTEAVTLANRLNAAFELYVQGAAPKHPGAAPAARSWATPYTATEWAERSARSKGGRR